jgi:hypothetical protein
MTDRAAWENPPMLPDRYFNPLNPAAVIDAAYEDPDDESTAREMIRQALLDVRGRGDQGVFDLAWECVEFYDDDEFPAAVDLLDEVIAAHPDQRVALSALRAAYREPAGVAEIESLHRDLMLLLPERRDVRFYYLAPGVLADAGDPGRGAVLAREGVELATSLGLPEAADQIIQRSPAPEHQEQATERLKELMDGLTETIRRDQVAATPQGKRAFSGKVGTYRMAYLPEREYAKAMTEGLLDATFPADHEDYRREMELSLLNTSDMGKVTVMRLDVAGVLAFAERTGKDPARRSSRLAYLSEMDATAAVRWPPERNAACWCGSGRKYKKCCGRPGFRDEPIPDRARAVLRIEPADATPRVAAPSRIRLDHLHKVLAEAIGLHDDHLYAFEIDGGEILDPRAEDDAPTADEADLSQLANEPGQSFVYRHGGEHRVTVEEFVEVNPAANKAQVLDSPHAQP